MQKKKKKILKKTRLTKLDGDLLERILRRCVSCKCFPYALFHCAYFHLGLRQGSVVSFVRHQVSDLYGRRNSWWVALAFLYLLGLVLVLIHTLLVRSSFFLFSLLLYFLFEDHVSFRGPVWGWWWLYRWGQVFGSWLHGTCCQCWCSGGHLS